MARIRLVLARTDVPALQVTDLLTRPSKGSKSPRPQSMYVRRSGASVPEIYPNGTLAETASDLAAYLLDTVEPGGIEVPTATITVALPQDGDTVVIGGVTFTAAGAADLPNQVFASVGGNNAVATSLAAAINHANAVGLIAAANGGIAVAATALAAVVTVRAQVAAEVVDARGSLGALTITTSNADRLALPAAVATQGGVLPRTHYKWTKALLRATCDALMDRVAAGADLTAIQVNIILTAEAGSQLSGGGSQSHAVLTDLLDVVAGRGYEIPKGVSTHNATIPAHWVATSKGSFTHLIPGSTVPVDIRALVPLVDTDELRVSLFAGSLSKYTTATNVLNSTFNFGGRDRTNQPYEASLVTNARLVVVYDDEGNVIV